MKGNEPGGRYDGIEEPGMPIETSANEAKSRESTITPPTWVEEGGIAFLPRMLLLLRFGGILRLCREMWFPSPLLTSFPPLVSFWANALFNETPPV